MSIWDAVGGGYTVPAHDTRYAQSCGHSTENAVVWHYLGALPGLPGTEVPGGAAQLGGSG